MTKPRVVFAYRYAILGGVSVQLMNRHALLAEHFDVRYLFEEDHGMVAELPSGSAEVAASADSRVSALRSLDPDILVVIDSPSIFRAWAESGCNGRVVAEVHTTTANLSWVDSVNAAVEIDSVLTPSEYMRDRLVGSQLAKRASVQVIPNCLAPAWFAEPVSIDVGVRPLAWVGKLDGHKRFRLAIDIADRVVGRVGNGVVPVFIGGYTAREVQARSLLDAVGSRATLQEARWWPWVDHRRMPGVLASVATSGGGMLSTTMNESFGMSVAEALVVGCPVVAPRVGALPELLPEEALYAADDAGAAVEIVSQMYSDKGFRSYLIESAGTVRERVRPEHAVGALVAALEAVIA